MEITSGITQPARYCSERSHSSRLLSVTALFGLLFLPLLAGGVLLPFGNDEFTGQCILTPDALYIQSDDFFCEDDPVLIQCHVSVVNDTTAQLVLSLTFQGNDQPGFPECNPCSTIAGQSTLAMMKPLISRRNWSFGVTAIRLQPIYKKYQYGTGMQKVLLSPPYYHYGSTLVPGHHSADKLLHLSGQYPAGLPYVYYWLRIQGLVNDSKNTTLSYDLKIRLDSEHNGNSATESQVFVNKGTALPSLVHILIGPILRNMTLTPWQAGKPNCADTPLPSMGRYEHLGAVEYHFEPGPEVAAQWLEVAFPDIIGPLSATTSAGQNLSSNCTNVLPAGTFNCTVALTDQPPLNWLLLRAGTLPDAETLNLTDLAAFWAVRQLSANDQGYHWQPAPIPATGYQLHIHCPDDAEYQDFVDKPRLEGGTGDSVHTCNLTLTPQYNQQLWEEHSLKAEIQLRYNRSSSATPSATPSETPIMVGVTSTVIPTGTPLPDKDKTAWEHWGRWTTVGGAIGVVVGVALAAAGITYSVVNMRRQTLHGEKP